MTWPVLTAARFQIHSCLFENKASNWRPWHSPSWLAHIYIYINIYIQILIVSEYTLQGINISYLEKRKIIFKSAFLWDMLVPRRVYIYIYNIYIYIYSFFFAEPAFSAQLSPSARSGTWKSIVPTFPCTSPGTWHLKMKAMTTKSYSELSSEVQKPWRTASKSHFSSSMESFSGPFTKHLVSWITSSSCTGKSSTECFLNSTQSP